jgi:hypothetical protein
MELTVISAVKAKALEEERALRKQKELEKRRKYTEEYCERLGAELEELANRGKKLVVSFKCSYFNEPLKSTNTDYSDRRLSYNSESYIELDMDYLKEWFQSYCFEVKVSKMYYWRYGCGECEGYDVVITPAPQCLN